MLWALWRLRKFQVFSLFKVFLPPRKIYTRSSASNTNVSLAERWFPLHNFPFGSPLCALKQVPLKEARVFVLGVYASAVHARWLNPDGSTRVAAMAVASEPHIFWRGEDEAEIIASIQIPTEAGRLVPPRVGMNGPSGAALDRLYLEPLALTRENSWLSDLLPQTE